MADRTRASRDLTITECFVKQNAINAERAKRGYSLQRTANLAGLSMRQLVRIITKENCPSLENAMALAAVFEMPVTDLFTVRVKTQVAPDVLTGRRVRHDAAEAR